MAAGFKSGLICLFDIDSPKEIHRNNNGKEEEGEGGEITFMTWINAKEKIEKNAEGKRMERWEVVCVEALTNNV